MPYKGPEEVYIKLHYFCSVEILIPDAPGASPRRLGAPIAMRPYYLYTEMENFSRAGNAESSHAPPPPTGAGLAQGGRSYLMQ
jgi:hypothetical protein